MSKPRPNCTHILSAHVIYDKPAASYRAKITCLCGLMGYESRKLHERFNDARDEAATMPLWIDPPPVKRRIRNRRVTAAPPPPITPTPAEARAAWVGYWKTLCAQHGHESKL